MSDRLRGVGVDVPHPAPSTHPPTKPLAGHHFAELVLVLAADLERAAETLESLVILAETAEADGKIDAGGALAASVAHAVEEQQGLVLEVGGRINLVLRLRHRAQPHADLRQLLLAARAVFEQMQQIHESGLGLVGVAGLLGRRLLQHQLALALKAGAVALGRRVRARHGDGHGRRLAQPARRQHGLAGADVQPLRVLVALIHHGQRIQQWNARAGRLPQQQMRSRRRRRQRRPGAGGGWRVDGVGDCRGSGSGGRLGVVVGREDLMMVGHV